MADQVVTLVRAATAAVEEARRRADPEPWPELDLAPLGTRRTPAPPCPLPVFGPWEGWLRDAAEIASAPVDYVGCSLLCAAGAMVANAFWASPWPGWREPPIIWAGCVGLPSSSKSPAIDAVAGPIRDAEKMLGEIFPELHREWQRQAAAAEARAKEWKRRVKEAVEAGSEPPEKPAEAESPPEPRRPRLYTTDATMEAAALLCQQQQRGLMLIRDELAGWIGALDKYGGDGAERAFWLEAYGGRAKVVDRIKFDGHELYVPHLSIPILGGIQPDRLASMILAGDDDGLASRFILVWPEPVPLRRPSAMPDPGRLATALARLRALEPASWAEGDRSPVPVRFEDDAATALHEFRLEVRALEHGVSGLLLSHVGKWPGLAARLALILELLWWTGQEGSPPGGPTMVSRRAALAAIGFVSGYVHPMARRVYGEAGLPKVERDACTIARWLAREVRARAPERVSVREIQRARLTGLATASDVKAALAELEADGWVRPAPARPGQPGRPAGDWLLAPHLRDALP